MSVSAESKRSTDSPIGKRTFYSLRSLPEEKIAILPFSVRVLLESALRNCDGFHVTKRDVENIVNWKEMQWKDVEIPFKPARVILQDLTGVPAVVDLASMRDAVSRLGGEPRKINPICPTDLVVDHSVQVDVFGNRDAIKGNQEIEFERNRERFQFLKWGANAFENMLIVPPGSGIVHQVNLEYLGRVVVDHKDQLFPDSVVGTDSHTTMINGLGVLGWGVGGIEAEAVMLGQTISMLLPNVIGYKLTGQLNELCTATDLVLHVTNHLRQVGVVGKFVEFFGSGVAGLTVADRATISNMCPEYGATVGFFPADPKTLEYLRQTGRDELKVSMIEAYLRDNLLLRDYGNASQDPEFSLVVELDLSTVEPCVAGPKRPHDKVPIKSMKDDFTRALTHPVGFKGFGIKAEQAAGSFKFTFEEGNEKETYELRHGSVVISAITSCTNTSNPTVILQAGLLAKNALAAGLKVAAYIKTSLSPGSAVVAKYLALSGLDASLEELGFYNVGYGCMTCIGNSGPLPASVAKVIEDNDLVAAAVLSGNRNFEGRVHPLTRANYLASPPLCVAYALAGRVDIDFEREPIGQTSDGRQIFLRDIWPSRLDVLQLEQKCVTVDQFSQVYKEITLGSDSWRSLGFAKSFVYDWDPSSTYIKSPPYFDGMTMELPALKDIVNAYCLVNLGDSVTTDHISPAGNIARMSPAAKYLQERGVEPREFNTYGARRGHDEVMARGTFANIRLLNKFIGRQGPKTIHVPSGEQMSVFDAAERYRAHGQPVIILAGKEYGQGSSRDWAAKGPLLLGVRAVLSETMERIHRSNLIGMGIIPLQYLNGENAESLGLTGRERFTIRLPPADQLKPGIQLPVETDNGLRFNVLCRFDTEVELEYFRHGGILHYMIRKLLRDA